MIGLLHSEMESFSSSETEPESLTVRREAYAYHSPYRGSSLDLKKASGE